ncbi:dockerin type I domain-containing protein, partial [Dolichospermum sp. ST_sed4]|nr:dockerin type I domain-containing protein [Dolichospermum sp. ST_sed4]
RIIFKAKNSGTSKLILQNVSILDSDGKSMQVSLTNSQVNVSNALYDINKDGEINVDDLLFVAGKIGTTITLPLPEPNPDINGDGVVNMFDLVILCKHFGELLVDAAPGLEAIKLNDRQLAVVKGIYKQVNNITSNEPDIIMTKEFLGRLIDQNISKITESRLLQNYPTPFNPETWIPYQLN